MARYFIELAYKGTNYHGWQIQNNATSVQAHLNNALSVLTRSNIETVGCGRTDTGVHASQFFAHFDSPEPLEPNLEIVYKLNAILPFDISILSVNMVHDDAHARFDATARSYSYYIATKKEIFQKDYTLFFPSDLNLEKMNLMAALLLNHQDYGCFSKSGGQQFTNLCTITQAQFVEAGNYVRFKITANRFLRGMVRAIVGTMIEIGKGKITEQEFKELLLSGDRKLAGPSVPAEGLFLEEIKYPYLSSTPISPINL
jgi:tRNA pseudouridine38-40 synthase